MQQSNSEPEVLPYGVLLRCLGEQLDAARGWNVLVLDVGKGFTVRYNRGDVQTAKYAAFSYDELLEGDRQAQSRRKEYVPGREPPPVERPNGYRDTLRAIGTQLQTNEHTLVLLDEQPDTFMISYIYRDEERARFPHKGMRDLTQEEARRLCDEAVAGRKPIDGKQSRWKRIWG